MNEEQKWVNISRQEIIFDEQKCLLLSFRDVSAAHQLKHTKHDVQVLKRLQTTISRDFDDPLNLINTSAKWLLDSVINDKKQID